MRSHFKLAELNPTLAKSKTLTLLWQSVGEKGYSPLTLPTGRMNYFDMFVSAWGKGSMILIVVVGALSG